MPESTFEGADSIPSTITPCSLPIKNSNRKPLQLPYTGQYQVLESNDKVFKVQIGNRIESASIDRLKPVHLDHEKPVEVAQPPARGRP